MPEDYQNFIRYKRHIEDDLGYAGIKAVSFKVTKTNYSLTAIYKSKKKNANSPPTYLAEVSSYKSKPDLFFRTYKTCNITDNNRLIEKTINISNQRITSHYMCTKVPGKSSETQELYIIKSQAGKDFARNEFSNKSYVFVKFEDMEIPFDTKGFSTIWDEESKPSL